MQRRARHILTVALTLVAAACGDDGGGASTTRPAATTITPTPVPTTTAPPTTSAPSTTSLAAAPVDTKIYLTSEGRIVIAHRQVPGDNMVRAAIDALLAGTTSAEARGGTTSAVPSGTRLLNVTVDGGLAVIDLSSAFGTGGGTLSMEARVAQIVFTATQFDAVDRVLFLMDGAPIEFLGGEGLILTEPQTRASTDRTITGSVLIDSPAPGSTVSSTFTVTGEGDVYEGQFPIEVWAGDQQVGGIAPVTAGAWGTWAPFSVTITVDAPPGPIELIAYDEGGCGTDPECPPIVKTVVPLTLKV